MTLQGQLDEVMQHIMIWLRTDDYDRWQSIHD